MKKYTREQMVERFGEEPISKLDKAQAEWKTDGWISNCSACDFGEIIYSSSMMIGETEIAINYILFEDDLAEMDETDDLNSLDWSNHYYTID